MENTSAKRVIDAVADKLLKYMGEQGLTQYKLAKLSNLPFGTVKTIMQRRTRGIELKTLILLANGLGVTPSEFINDCSFLAENLILD